MSGFGFDSFAASPQPVEVEVYTSVYRVSGTVHTPFRRVAEIPNQLAGGHLVVEGATLAGHADGAPAASAASVLVAVDEILLLMAPGLSAEARSEMRIEKRAVRAVFALALGRLTGTIHVPHGSRAVDGLLNVPDRFMPVTDASIALASHPASERAIPILAVRRAAAHVVIVADDERPDELLAEVADEGAADGWSRSASTKEGLRPDP